MTDKIKHVIIDADVLVYRVGFAAEQDEPIENTLHSAKKCVVDISGTFGGIRPELFLTGSNNFRKYIAKTLEYKGNRKATPKPQYYEEIRQYFEAVWGATVIHDMEADDAMGIAQYSRYKASSVICSIDKDMKMIPGHHYNFVKKELVYVTKDEGLHWFFQQLLQGDRTDNIQGIKGLGPRTALKLLEGCSTPDDMYEVCKREYAKAYGADWEPVIDEMAQLLWILRSEDSGCPYMTQSSEGWCPSKGEVFKRE